MSTEIGSDRCSRPRHSRLFSATFVAGAVCLAFIPIAHAQQVETARIELNECYFDGQRHGRKIGKTNYDNVSILYETLRHPRAGYGPRPIQVTALIIPGIKVGHRGTTPQPSSGFHTGGENDVDPGHVIALHLGGPDHSLNIVPQWAHWQRLEEWRKMERSLDEKARKIADESRPPGGGPPTRTILMNVAIEYTKTGNIPRRTAWSFPKAFYVMACPVKIADHDHGCDGPKIYNQHKFEGGPPH
jgi:hypothetical protein